MGLLFINALKGLKKKKIQMLGIVFMVLLGVGIFTTMNLSLDRMETRYYEYLDTQNVQDFGITPTIDYKKDYTYEEVTSILDNNSSKIDDTHKLIIQKYASCLGSNDESCIDDSLIEMISGIFYIYSLNEAKSDEKLKNLSIKYDFYYEYQESKAVAEGKYLTQVFPYVDNQINKSYLLEGNVPKNNDEITVLKLFAEENNFKVGSTYKFNGNEYKIVGFMYASDYIYPLISINNPMYDKKHNNIIFTTKEEFDNINGITENDYVGRFNSRDNINKQFVNLFNLDYENLEERSDEESEASLTMSGMLSLMRTRQPEMEFETNRLFAEYFLYFLLSVCVVVIVIITKKRIDDERLQIGVLKSLGYKSLSIATSYLVYPMVGSLIGGLLGYLMGYLLNPLLANEYRSYYCFPIGENIINFNHLAKVIFVPISMLCVLSYIVSLFMLRKKPLALLREGSNLKINIFTKFTTFITKRLSFNSRFKYSLASRSLGKLMIIFITSFSTGMLIVLTLIGMNLFNSMVNDMFDKYHFDNQVTYMVTQYNEDKNGDLVYNVNMELTKILNNNDKYKKLPEETTKMEFLGVDSNFKSMEFIDYNEKDLLPLVKGNDIIITTTVKESLGIDVGNKIILTYNDKSITYNVVGIYDDYFNLNAVVDRETLSLNTGLDRAGYNLKLTKDEKYGDMKLIDSKELSQVSNIISVNQLKSNVEGAMEQFNASMYIVVAFAALMALIIIAVIANIVVEENRKTISLMKVMGYKNKVISKIVLNIYTPFVIGAYVLSIPVTISILKAIVGALVGTMNISIPISLSWQNALIGLFGLLIAYYIAINLSRRVLNKVPLAVALKRE